MLFDFDAPQGTLGDSLVSPAPGGRWGADSEYGVLRDVMLSTPRHLEMVPCNSVTKASLDEGLALCEATTAEQHATLVQALDREGVRCHFVPPVPDLADLCFTRDSTLMTPWGLLTLRPAVAHRNEEAAAVRQAAESWGVPILGALEEGCVEGGDVCLVRPGVVAIGRSGERTDEAGTEALARLFEERGWRALRTRFDPHFLHLDTLITMVDRHRAVACVEGLEEGFVAELHALDIDLLPVTLEEVDRLGANILSLGERRLVSTANNARVNGELERLGYRVVALDIDQFVRCGGGIHCLTMPLSRLPG
jgi:N-dimethylarginine dimethylaminohydrolase